METSGKSKEEIEQEYSELKYGSFSVQGRLYPLLNASASSSLCAGTAFFKKENKWYAITNKEAYLVQTKDTSNIFKKDTKSIESSQFKGTIIFYYGYKVFANALQKYIARNFIKRHNYYTACVYRNFKRTPIYYKGVKVGLKTDDATYNYGYEGLHDSIITTIKNMNTQWVLNNRYTGVDCVVFTKNKEQVDVSVVRTNNQVEKYHNLFTMGSIKEDHHLMLIESLIKEKLLKLTDHLDDPLEAIKREKYQFTLAKSSIYNLYEIDTQTSTLKSL